MTRMMVLSLLPQQAAVFSARAATLGAHASLNAPTGANLLGWAAGQCHDVIADALYGGRLRFSNAVRMLGDKGAFAGPATLLQAKHTGGSVYLGRARFEAACPDVQAEAVKERLFTLSGAEAPSPRYSRRLRTAMKNGVADEGRLFGYQAVEAGQTCLRATVELESGTEAEWQALHDAFVGRTLHLGRGAASGFGGAYACTVSEQGSPWPNPRDSSITGGSVRFWLLSDALLVDQWGSPRLEPRPYDFGLGDGWSLDRSESSGSTRRIWPWNGTYKSRDTEFAVIEAGAVFTFRHDGGSGSGKLPRTIGQGAERGFGRYVVLADNTDFTLSDDEARDKPAEVDAVSNVSALIAFAKERLRRSQGHANAEWADGQISNIEQLLNSLNGDGPGPSQWSQLAELVPKQGDADFEQKLDKLLKSDDWQAGFGILANWVKTEFFANNVTPAPSHADWQRVLSRARSMAQGGQ
jgi:hypothetical protein